MTMITPLRSLTPITPVTRIKTERGMIDVLAGATLAEVQARVLDGQLGAFWRYGHSALEQQHGILADIAAAPDGRVILACTADGVIVGYILFHNPEESQPYGKELAGRVVELGSIEVSRRYRGTNLAREMLRVAFAEGFYDDRIVFTQCFAWHWDLEGTGLAAFSYRDKLVRLFRGVGMEPQVTDEPNILDHPANVLLARRGERVTAAEWQQFTGNLVGNAEFDWF